LDVFFGHAKQLFFDDPEGSDCMGDCIASLSRLRSTDAQAGVQGLSSARVKRTSRRALGPSYVFSSSSVGFSHVRFTSLGTP
jgi:hypothetical protein